MFEKGGGIPSAVEDHSSFPRRHYDLELEHLVSGHSGFRLRHTNGRQLGHLALRPHTSQQTREAPSPTSAAGRGRAGLGHLPAPAHVPAKGSVSHLASFPCLRGLRGQSRGESSRGGQGEVWLLSPPQGGPRCRKGSSATVQRGHEEDAVPVLKLVVQLALVQERDEGGRQGHFSSFTPSVRGRGAPGCFGRERLYQRTRYPVL